MSGQRSPRLTSLDALSSSCRQRRVGHNAASKDLRKEGLSWDRARRFGPWWQRSSQEPGRPSRLLLVEGLGIHKLREAYLLDGDSFATASLSNSPNLRTTPSNAPWLRQVEVRTVLDAPTWNSPAQSCYGFVEGRRAWIVRDVAQPGLSYCDGAGNAQPIHPALLSSQAMHELCGWIERVASVAPRYLFLSGHARAALWPLLVSVAGEDRIAVFGDRLSSEAKSCLRWYFRKYGTR
jgi:hypothetical protein